MIFSSPIFHFPIKRMVDDRKAEKKSMAFVFFFLTNSLVYRPLVIIICRIGL